TGDILTPNVNLNDYMEYNSTSISLNVTANTTIIEGSSYTEREKEKHWYMNDLLHVTGNLTWDNGTAMDGYYVNVTVKYTNGTIISYNDSVIVDEFGGFDGTLTVDDSWPDLQSETVIEVKFNPFDPDNFGTTEEGYYVENSNKEYS
ncbi:MAG: hypothetical protein ACOC4M_02555, partial [Promethearchaeia archaeon]